MREKLLPSKMVIMQSLFGIFVSCLLVCCPLVLSPSYFFGVLSNASASETILIPEQHLFKDFSGNMNIAGVVKNNGFIPVHIVVGLNTTTTTTNKNSNGDDTNNTESDQSISTIQNTTYSRIVYPSSSSPFKFVVPSGNSVLGKAFIVNVRELAVPLYDNLVLNYSNVAAGDNKALIGTVKNVGPVELHDVSVYASVHSNNKTQIDSVESNLIPVIKPGQELPFSAVPDPSVRDAVMYFSCAGVDLDAPITTLKVDDDEFIPYDLQAIAKITSLEYVNTTDSISFGVKHYNPDGGDLSLRVPQLSQNQTILVKMDDKKYDDTSVEMDGKTIDVKLFVPPGDHEVDIQGVRNKV
jgi:hypothetical protein